MLQMNRKKKGYFVIGIISIIGLTLLILPATFFDEGQSICISVLLLDKQCYACGMTRAVQHLIHFDFNAAANYNKLVFIVVPLGIYTVISEIYKKYFKNPEH
jgi:hypothetical protein